MISKNYIFYNYLFKNLTKNKNISSKWSKNCYITDVGGII